VIAGAIAVTLLPAFIAWAAIAWLRRPSTAALLPDVPNERSLHAVVTPRVGGLGLLAGALSVAAWFADVPLGVMLACACVLALVSAADDRRSLPIAVRLPAHVAAAAVAILAIAAPGAAREGLGIVEAAVALAAIVWMTNLYNFMDGSDGLAGGMTLIGFGALAIAACLAGQWPLAATCAAIACASAGFLAHNFPPARVFLGDAGSVPLGFLAGALSLHGILSGAWPVALPLVAFSPFIADASVTLARRVVRGERFWRAHRSHYYQRLVLSGWTPRRLALAAYALMLAAAASALASRKADPAMQLAIIAGWAALYAALFLAIGMRRQEQQT
jgi:UDP-N-acetylmuramyl pentapeptide phosphotransferase/UDP-N-acetylglucosamine-1-phosphate transferase